MLSLKIITLTTMKEMAITTGTIETIIKYMMVIDTSARMIAITNEDYFKVKDNILEIEKIDHVIPSSVYMPKRGTSTCGLLVQEPNLL